MKFWNTTVFKLAIFIILTCRRNQQIFLGTSAVHLEKSINYIDNEYIFKNKLKKNSTFLFSITIKD